MTRGLLVHVHGYSPPLTSPGPSVSALASLQQAAAYAEAEVWPHIWNSAGRRSPKTPDDFGSAVRRAKVASIGLAERLAGIPEGRYDFVDVSGFSLGCRVVHGALGEAEVAPGLVRNVALFGGAFPARRSWWSQVSRISGTLTNFYSGRDVWLKLYEAYLGSGRCVGRPSAKGTSGGISTRLCTVSNVDVTADVGGHGKWGPRLGQLISSAAESAGPGTSYGDWRDEFRWTPAPRFPSRLRVDNRGAKTEIVQRALTAPLDGGEPLLLPEQIDGLPGSKTDGAVRQFQHRNGLKDSGEVNQATWDLLVQVEADIH